MGIKVGDMFDPSYEGLSQEDIKASLDAIAYDVKEGSYTKRLTAEEVQACEKQYAYLSIEAAEATEAMQEKVKSMKAEIKGINEEAIVELEKIKFKTEHVKGILYEVVNEEDKVMEIFDENGICTEVRPLKREERQTKIHSITDLSKRASNG